MINLPDVYKRLSCQIDPESYNVQFVVNLLNLPPEERSDEMLSFLMDHTQRVKFFQEMRLEHGESLHRECCRHLKTEDFAAQSFVFSQGELGSKFYIILRGKVRVLMGAAESQRQVGQLAAGSSFGDVALVKEQPRMATVQCVNKCQFAVLEKSIFNQLFGKSQHEKLQTMIEFLKTVPIFARWTRRAIEKVSFYFKSKHFYKGTEVFKEGDLASQVFIVKKGEFCVKKSMQIDSPSAKKAKKTTMRVSLLGEKELFGDEEVSENDLRNYTCVCSSIEGELLVIAKTEFASRVKDLESMGFLHKKNELKEQLRISTIGQITRSNLFFSEHYDRQERHHRSFNLKKKKKKLKPISLTPSKSNNKKVHDFRKLIRHIRTGLEPRLIKIPKSEVLKINNKL